MAAMRVRSTNDPRQDIDQVPEPTQQLLTFGDWAYVLTPAVPTRERPNQLIERYVDAAMRRARTKQYPDGMWFAETALPDVWGTGSSESEALMELQSVIEDWIGLKIDDQDRDFPVLEEIDLNWL